MSKICWSVGGLNTIVMVPSTSNKSFINLLTENCLQNTNIHRYLESLQYKNLQNCTDIDDLILLTQTLKSIKNFSLPNIASIIAVFCNKHIVVLERVVGIYWEDQPVGLW